MIQNRMGRRQFLARASAGAVAGMLLGSQLARAQQTPVASTAPLFKISLAQWSLNPNFFKFLGRNSNRAGSDALDPLDFAKIAKNEFGIEAIEYVNQFYAAKKNDPDYFKELKKRADDHGVRSVLIMIDQEGQIGDADDAKREQTVENHKKWVEHARLLGCHSIRVNAGSSGSFEEQQKRAADGLSKLTDFASTMEINVIVENHGGLSSNGEWLAGVMKMVNKPRCGTLPDFGNFRLGGNQNYDRYKGVEELMPFAKGVSAKCYDFDEKGDETTLDFRKLMKTVIAHDYHGHVGIEYEGQRLTPFDGVRACKKLLESIRTEMSKVSK